MAEPDGSRKGMPPVKLTRYEFERRYRSRFIDPAFAPPQAELDAAIVAAAWDALTAIEGHPRSPANLLAEFRRDTREIEDINRELEKSASARFHIFLDTSAVRAGGRRSQTSCTTVRWEPGASTPGSRHAAR